MLGFFLVGLVCVMIPVLKLLEVYYLWSDMEN
jgi:hypothetical protein